MDSIPNARENVVPNPSSYGFGVERLHINTVPYSRQNPAPNNSVPNPPNPHFEDALDVEEDIHMDAVSVSSETHGIRTSSDAVLEDDDIHLVNDCETHVPYPSSDAILNDKDTNAVNEVEHPLLLFGEQEPPFVYLATLSIRLFKMNIQSVRGKVKVHIIFCYLYLYGIGLYLY